MVTGVRFLEPSPVTMLSPLIADERLKKQCTCQVTPLRGLTPTYIATIASNQAPPTCTRDSRECTWGEPGFEAT